MEQSSEYLIQEEEMGALSSVEHARIIEYLRAVGLEEKQINDMWMYVATGVGLPMQEPDSKEE